MGVKTGTLCDRNPGVKYNSLPSLSRQYRLECFRSTKFRKMARRVKVLQAVVSVTTQRSTKR